MIQAYWNTYTGNEIMHPDRGVNLEDVAQGVYDQIRVREAALAAGLLTRTRNLGGENLELEVAGVSTAVAAFVLTMEADVVPPFLIYADTQAEEREVRGMLRGKTEYPIDIEIRDREVA